ncbi:MAG: glycosyltransferase [Candidatus Bathyarchaeota archaeon]|nr:glycosyltransferase [Candidatus Bathyarchaeota archaeon]
MKRNVGRPWDIEVTEDFEPEVSILIPAHNEEANIEPKLENIRNVYYPMEKMEIIVVDDASEDNTVNNVERFRLRHPDLNIKLLKQNPRAGKATALNKALQLSTKPIVIVSDADTRWPQDILKKAMPYLADARVGAVTGRGVNVNAGESWVTEAEESYLQLANFVRFAESKIHSTIRFEGGFCAYKRNAFDLFDCETGSDDSGTALKVVLNGYRSIMLPEIVFYTSFPPSLLPKFKIKVRRANQLVGLWVKCLKLMFGKHLSLPKRIAIPEIFLFLINPVAFLILNASSIALIIFQPFFPLSLAIIFLISALLLLKRRIFVELFIDNLILVSSLMTFLFGRRYIFWKR